MPRIKLFLMRHSKSCCNHIRHDVEKRGSGSATARLSQQIRDPALSVEGRRTAIRYAPTLRHSLAAAGFNVEGARVLCSKLRRAKETAGLVFGRSTPIDHFTENGVMPENTPADSAYQKPDWSRFIQELARIAKDGDSVAVVGHGSYLGSLWPLLTGHERTSRLNNLDGILLDIEISTGHVFKHREILCPLKAKDRDDKCTVDDTRKIAALSKRMTRKQITRTRTRTNKRRQQGGASMPLGFHQAGAQFAGTTGYPTGDQTVFPTEGLIRNPLRQTGGFTPSVMGAFASNGARLIPIAGYMGYQMYSNKNKKQKHSTRRKSRASRA